MEDSEKRFESDIESYLLNEGGYVKGNLDTYDKKRAIDMPVLISFLEKTQPKKWQRFKNVHGANAENQLYNIFQQNVAQMGLIHVLRNKVKDNGIELKFAYFAPASSLNEDLVEKYNQNILTCTRQFSYTDNNHNTIDMVLSLNGIPVVALELKNQFKGQTVENGMKQWREDRDPKEFIFWFNNRILCYFAADLDNVYMSTELKGDSTYFLPFNQGSNGAGEVGDGGNPANPDGYPTSYLWEKVLRRDMLLAILQRYISREEKTTISIKNGKQVSSTSVKIIFPRYHQLNVVERLVEDTRKSKEGTNFLIQHSAGSGKSNSIAWLTYRLANLHDEDDSEMFQSVFVVTDRRILNKQLQDTILGFEHTTGQVVTIENKDTSDKLLEAINNKKKIIITTLHRFPLVYKELDNHAGKRFAIIVDEAHSSQSGKSAEKLKAALADTDEALKEMAEIEERSEAELKDEMDVMLETLLTQGKHKNQYFYAFTATPKPKTLQTFGIQCGVDKEGKPMYSAYHHYSMRQAIDEGFILNVLEFFTPVDTSYEILKNIKEDPELEEPPAARAIRAYHDNHQYVIENTAELIVEKFREITLKKIGGKAKAMVVSPSRAHAVRYYFAILDYCKKKHYTDVNPLVAFSGEVEFGGKTYQESKMNMYDGKRISESQLPLYFASDLFNILVVAEKYQTGFDEPLLHTMFVLKHLNGVKAVQTLSRLNRCCKGKNDTYVLDFCNTTDSIQASFKPFYEDTLLAEPVDINVVYKYENELRKFHLWSQEDEDKLYEIYKSKQDNKTLGKLASCLKPAMEAYAGLIEDDQFKVRFLVRSFVRFYAYMAQISRTFDKDLYKTYIFCDYLFKALPKNPREKIDLSGKLMLEHHRFDVQPSVSIDLNPNDKEKTFKGEKGKEGKKKEEPKDLLSNIIEKVNLMYQGEFSEADRVIVESIYDRMQTKKKTLTKLVKNSDVNMFTNDIFPKEFEDVAQQCYMEQMDSFKRLFQDKQLYDRLMEEMGKALYHSLRNQVFPAKKSKVIPYSSAETASNQPMTAKKPERISVDRVEPTKENTLYLPIKQVYFDQIVEGTKTEEYRNITDTTYKKYLQCDADGNPFFDEAKLSADDPNAGDPLIWNNGVYPYIPKEYKYLNLAVGYAKERDSALVEVTGYRFMPDTLEDGKPVRLTLEGDTLKLDANGDLCNWIIAYQLGEVVELHRKQR